MSLKKSYNIISMKLSTDAGWKEACDALITNSAFATIIVNADLIIVFERECSSCCSSFAKKCIAYARPALLAGVFKQNC